MSLLDPAELDDVVELRVDLAPLHPEDRAVEEDVLAPGELGVEARPDLEDAADAAADRQAVPSVGGVIRVRSFSSVDLPGAVAPDEPDDLARLDLERDVLQRPELLERVVDPLETESPPCRVRERVTQGLVARCGTRRGR